MPVEFLGIAATNDGSETTPAPAPPSTRTTRSGWPAPTRTTAGTGCCSPTAPAPPTRPQAAAYVATRTETPPAPARPPAQRLVSRRSPPRPSPRSTRSATAGSTVHFITGGNDHEQQREGDSLTKDERYDRTREYIQIVKQAWTTHEPFDHEGEHYRFDDFVSDIFPVQQPHPERLVRRLLGRRLRGRAAPRPTSTACGASRWPRPPSRSRRCRPRRRRPGRTDVPAHPGRVPADHRARPRSWPGRRRTAPSSAIKARNGGRPARAAGTR